MARLPYLTTRESLPPEALPVFDAIVDQRGSINTPMSVLMHVPELALATTNLGTYLRFKSSLSEAVKELAIITTARQFDCEFVWAAHVPAALKAGVPQAVVDRVNTFGDTAGISEEQAEVITFGRELVGNHKVSQQSFDAIRNRHGVQGLIELEALIGYYLAIACTLLTADVEIPEGRPRFASRAAAGSV
jgi:4-carboxymuconolactone decarboxylase